ncbi:hypothetical protein SAMN05660662_0862 [Blastococcus aurantiacus]|uniref:Uncharacterized protein n=1 Tax=Blastococcus aurantiacus TaxID=1550231 RepID=A0A1G7HWB3_9ACTN|nr:hypothetical protein [Blastococcus aurantiacus]SDF04760.1 hypothetical protein SAMN05660662_0862 [Blastococcus aurantiacus]
MQPRTPPPSSPPADRARVDLPWPTILAVAVLTVGAVLLGQRDWAVPERVLRDWQVADVPSSLTALVLGVTATCLLVGSAVTLRGAALRPRDPVFLVWLAVSLLAAAALIWNALVLAADAEFQTGALIPVFHWMFTFVPALLTGLAARNRGAVRAVAAALGTGVVTVPLLGLGWSLFASRESMTAGLGNSLWATALLGVGPLVIAAAISRSSALSAAWKREHPTR